MGTLISKVLIIFLILSFFQLSWAKSIRQYQKEIKKNTEDLEDLQKSINQKKAEKEKCLKEEKSIREELQIIDAKLTKLQNQKNKLNKDIKTAEYKLSQTRKQLDMANWQKRQWIDLLKTEFNTLNKHIYTYYKLFQEPYEEKLRVDALKQKRNILSNTMQKEKNYKLAYNKWQRQERKLVKLKNQKETNLREQKSVKESQKKILDTTVGRRIAAEQEIKKLAESAQMLALLITKLEKAKKETEERMLSGKKFSQSKRLLPWPVYGTVETTFGKSKHPELDTYVISNGIRIKASSSLDVKAVSRGEVIFCGPFRSYGEMIIIDHGRGFYTIYGLIDEILVTVNQKVKMNDIVGKLNGGSGRILYFELRSRGKSEDPLKWLRPL